MKPQLHLIAILLLCANGLFSQDYNMELLGRLEYDVELSDVWGYVDEQGNEYALVGLYDNFSIVDVTDPTSPNEVFRTIGGNSSDWRDIKTWGDYAYVTCECGPGLLIVDMSPLPENTNLTYTYWLDDSITFYQAHNLYIDEKGIAHIFGAFYSRGGSIMLDLNDDPMNPTPIGVYDENYLHDGVVRGDTLWGSSSFHGKLQVIDVSEPENPQLLSFWNTPNSFTHNAWFSDDSRYIFTTDEVKDGSIAAYDALNILNPIELDIWKVNDTAIIPHNTHFHQDYLITSHYTYGINIIDVKRPHNMVEVGHYDTSPDYRYEGFRGCWGAYPYLPSGNILATDIEEGLYIFNPNYERACYLEGAVTNKHTGLSIFFPEISILETNDSKTGTIVGEYAMAALEPGSYTVVASAEGYNNDTAYNVELEKGELSLLDFQLSDWPVGVEEALNQDGLHVYPNPANDHCIINSEQPLESIQILDANGVVVKKSPANGTQFRLDIDLPSGNYVLKAKSQNGLQVKQLKVLRP